jgi:hypothetical protein
MYWAQSFYRIECRRRVWKDFQVSANTIRRSLLSSSQGLLTSHGAAPVLFKIIFENIS